MFFFFMSPSLTNTINFFYTTQMRFELATMSKISLAMSIAYFLSIISIGLFYRDDSFRKFFLVSGQLSAIANLSILLVVFKFYNTISINPIILCYILNSLATFIQELNFLPVLGVCCKICPSSVESMSYAVFTSLFYTANVLGSLFTAILLKIIGITHKKYTRIWVVIVVQAAYQFAVLYMMMHIEYPRSQHTSIVPIDSSNIQQHSDNNDTSNRNQLTPNTNDFPCGSPKIKTC